MKRLIALILVCLPALLSAQETSFQRTVPLAPGKSVALDNYKGSLQIEAWDRNEVSVTAEKRFEGPDDIRREWMAATSFQFDPSADRVSFRVKYPNTDCWNGECVHPNWWNREYSGWVDVKVKVPRQANLDIETYKPVLSVTGVQGDLRIKSYKSPIEIRGTRGAVDIKTYKDTVQLTDVELTRFDFDAYKADLHVTARSLGQGVRIANGKGTVELSVPKQTAMDVRFDGERRSDFESELPVQTSGVLSPGRITGKVNGGGVPVSFQMSKGSVRLTSTTQ